MNTLYIIGNGFDRAHDLPTRYSHFHDYLWGHSFDHAQDFVCLIEQATNGVDLWSDFETALGKINPEEVIKRIIKESESEQDPDNHGAIAASVSGKLIHWNPECYKQLIEAFALWARSIKTAGADPEYAQLQLNNGANYFFTFNYTDTLETVYQVPHDRIRYIHGYARDPKSTIIVGHKHHYGEKAEREAIMQVIDKELPTDCGDSCQPLLELLNISIKETSTILNGNYDYFQNLAQSQIAKIIVIGHSYGEVDWPYFEAIQKACPNAQWELRCYSNDDRIRATEMKTQYPIQGIII